MPKTRDDLLVEPWTCIRIGVLVKDKCSLRPIMGPSGGNLGAELTGHRILICWLPAFDGNMYIF